MEPGKRGEAWRSQRDKVLSSFCIIGRHLTKEKMKKETEFGAIRKAPMELFLP
jgi:hypothetical protein